VIVTGSPPSIAQSLSCFFVTIFNLGVMKHVLDIIQGGAIETLNPGALADESRFGQVKKNGGNCY
jgi:hypothetical protein